MGDMDETLRDGGEAAVLDRLAKAQRLEPDDTSNVISLADYIRMSDGAPDPEPPPDLETPIAGLGEWNVGEIKMPPPRQWLLGTVFARGFVSSLLSEGAGGKTATRYAQYLALATGCNLTGEHVFQRCRVLIVSLEDNTEELERRLLAAMKHYGIDKSEVDGWLWAVAPGKSAGKIMTTDEKGHLRIGELTAKIAAVVEKRHIDLVALDPFVKSHSVEENKNSAIDDVMQVLTDLCATHNIAIDVPHHVSKGSADPGNSDRGRGASAMRDAARLVYTLAKMTPEEAKAFSVSEEDRQYLIRIDSAKVNIAPPAAKAQWFKLIGVALGNGNQTYPNGDTVQTVIQWTPPDLFTDLSVEVINRILDKIDAGLPDGERYSDSPRAKDRAAWRLVAELAPRKEEGPAKRVIAAWVKSGLLRVEDYHTEKDRKDVKGLFVDNGKRPL
jgi:hypothetical protein